MGGLEQGYLKFLQRKKIGLLDQGLFFLLQILSIFYMAGWWLRRTTYYLKLVPRKRLQCPVVSVGNITTGGTGKTPIVIELAKHFTEQGLRVAVLSRGYKRKRQTSKPLWVSDGQKILATVEESGDEPLLIARKVPKAAVIVHPGRYEAGLEAVKRFKPDLIILDDGFQRRFGLHRDLDLLVIDGLNPFSTGWTLPAGLLREPLSMLSEAGVFIINKADLAGNLKDIRTVLQTRNPRAFIVESRYIPVQLRDVHTEKKMSPAHLDGVPVGAISGVGNPIAFVRTLAEHKVLIRHAYTFDDHYAYTKEELSKVTADAKNRGLVYLVTTEKDEVKFPQGLELEVPILVLEIQWKVTGGQEQWDKILKGLGFASGAK